MKLLRTRRARFIVGGVGLFLSLELLFAVWSVLAHDITLLFLYPTVLGIGAAFILLAYGVLEGVSRLEDWVNRGEDK